MTNSIIMLVSLLGAITCFGYAAFWIHPIVGMIYIGVIALWVSFAAYECVKDKKGEDEP